MAYKEHYKRVQGELKEGTILEIRPYITSSGIAANRKFGVIEETNQRIKLIVTIDEDGRKIDKTVYFPESYFTAKEKEIIFRPSQTTIDTLSERLASEEGLTRETAERMVKRVLELSQSCNDSLQAWEVIKDDFLNIEVGGTVKYDSGVPFLLCEEVIPKTQVSSDRKPRVLTDYDGPLVRHVKDMLDGLWVS